MLSKYSRNSGSGAAYAAATPRRFTFTDLLRDGRRRTPDDPLEIFPTSKEQEQLEFLSHMLVDSDGAISVNELDLIWSQMQNDEESWEDVECHMPSIDRGFYVLQENYNPSRRQLERMKKIFPHLDYGRFDLVVLRDSFVSFLDLLVHQQWMSKSLDDMKAFRALFCTLNCNCTLPRWKGSHFGGTKYLSGDALKYWIVNFKLFANVFLESSRKNRFFQLMERFQKSHYYVRSHTINFKAVEKEIQEEKKSRRECNSRCRKGDKIVECHGKTKDKESKEEKSWYEALNPVKKVKESATESMMAGVGKVIKHLISSFIQKWPKYTGEALNSLVDGCSSDWIKNVYAYICEAYHKVENFVARTWSLLTGDTHVGNIKTMLTIMIFILVVYAAKKILSVSWDLLSIGIIVALRKMGFKIRTSIKKDLDVMGMNFQAEGEVVDGHSYMATILASAAYISCYCINPFWGGAVGGFVNTLVRGAPLIESFEEEFKRIVDKCWYSLTAYCSKDGVGCHAFPSTQECEEFEKKVNATIEFLQIPELDALIINDPVYTKRLAELVSDGLDIKRTLSQLRNSTLLNRYLKSFDSLMIMHHRALAEAKMYKQRIETMMVWMYGEAGEGKSVMLKALPQVLHSLLRGRYPDEYPEWKDGMVYERTKGSPFWERYIAQIYTTRNEMLASTDSKATEEELTEIMNMCEDNVYSLNRAFEAKGMSFFRSEVFLTTTNVFMPELIGPQKKFGIRNMSAIIRRQTFPLHVVRRQDYRIEEGKIANADDAWIFRVHALTEEYRKPFYKGVSRFLGLHPGFVRRTGKCSGEIVPAGKNHKVFEQEGQFDFTYTEIISAMFKELCFRKDRKKNEDVGAMLPVPVVDMSYLDPPSSSSSSLEDSVVEEIAQIPEIAAEIAAAREDARRRLLKEDDSEISTASTSEEDTSFEDGANEILQAAIKIPDMAVVLGDIPTEVLVQMGLDSLLPGAHGGWSDWFVDGVKSFTSTVYSVPDMWRFGSSYDDLFVEATYDSEPQCFIEELKQIKSFLKQDEISPVMAEKRLKRWEVFDKSSKPFTQSWGVSYSEQISFLFFSQHPHPFDTAIVGDNMITRKGLTMANRNIERVWDDNSWMSVVNSLVGYGDFNELKMLSRSIGRKDFMKFLEPVSKRFGGSRPITTKDRENVEYVSDIGLMVQHRQLEDLSVSTTVFSVFTSTILWSHFYPNVPYPKRLLMHIREYADFFPESQNSFVMLENRMGKSTELWSFREGSAYVRRQAVEAYSSLYEFWSNSDIASWIGIGLAAVGCLGALLATVFGQSNDPLKDAPVLSEDVFTHGRQKRSRVEIKSRAKMTGYAEPIQSGHSDQHRTPYQQPHYVPVVGSHSDQHRTPYNQPHYVPVVGGNSDQHRTPYEGNRYVPQIETHGSMEDIMGRARLIGGNVREIMFQYSTYQFKGYILMNGNVGMIPAHFLRGWGTGFDSIQFLGFGDKATLAVDRRKVRIVFCDGGEQGDLQHPADTMSFHHGDLKMPTRDLAFLHFHPKVFPPAIKLTCNFRSREFRDLPDKVGRIHRKYIKGNFIDTVPFTENVRFKQDPLTARFNVNGEWHMIKTNDVIVLHDLPSENGWCSLPIVSLDMNSGPSYILGINIAGGNGDSFAAPVYKEDFDQVWDWDGQFWADSAVCTAPNGAYIPKIVLDHILVEGKHSEVNGSFQFGTLDRTMFMPDVSDFTFSAFQGNGDPESKPLYPVVGAPAPLKPFLLNGEWIDPKGKALEKWFGVDKSKPTENWILDHEAAFPMDTSEGFFGDKDTVSPRPFRMLSIEEACEVVSSLKTSEGLFLRLHGLKREDVIKKDTNGKVVFVHQVLRDEVNNLMAAVRRGEIPKLCTIACLKDEIRDLDRVMQGKTRLFCVGDFVHMVWSIMVLGDMIAFLKKHRYQTTSAIGTNYHGPDWKVLYDQMTAMLGKFGGGDYGNYDTSLRFSSACQMGVDFVMFSGAIGDFARQIMYCCMAAAAPIVIMGNVVYWMDSGNPSGGYLTGLFNTYVNNQSFKIIWMKEQAKCKKECGCAFKDAIWREDLWKDFYGDDNLWNIRSGHGFEKHWNMDLISKSLYETLRMTYTLPSKASAEGVQFLELHEMEFLKRTWRDENGFIFAPLAKESIENMLMWVRDTGSAKQNKEQLKQNISVCSMEMSYYGKEEWEAWALKVKDACNRFNVLPFTGKTFEYQRMRHLQGFS